MARTEIERGARQAGSAGDAGMPGPWVVLVALLGGAAAWSFHFLGSYAVLAWLCTTRAGSARPILVALALVALAVTAYSGWLARRHWRIARAVDRPTDDSWDARMGERTARVSFLMVIGLVLAVIFALGIVYETIALFLAPLCQAGVSS